MPLLLTTIHSFIESLRLRHFYTLSFNTFLFFPFSFTPSTCLSIGFLSFNEFLFCLSLSKHFLSCYTCHQTSIPRVISSSIFYHPLYIRRWPLSSQKCITAPYTRQSNPFFILSSHSNSSASLNNPHAWTLGIRLWNLAVKLRRLQMADNAFGLFWRYSGR